ncbi:hypothetical protein [Pseudotabrizicola alkalilacus]|uniref:Uncharacterized protein n=1 Tax=Pseudotabrizicola alkalilacus TaxID=2305252 RepID=A0A411Z1I7_9RHOB|nr:hypothetical protein [Pseudotabrizicola alkalilacus]RGP36927.1 hypothetical protein D1012_12310 [Pseudotabrizicola alkalilacus]
MSFDYPLTSREQARLDLIVQKVEGDLAAEKLTVDRAEIAQCASIRLAVISETAGLSDSYLDEVKRLPSVRNQMQAREMSEALANLDSDTHRVIARLNPSQKLTLGRQLEAQKQTQEAPPATPKMDAELFAERLLLLRTLSPDVRITTARKWGMI